MGPIIRADLIFIVGYPYSKLLSNVRESMPSHTFRGYFSYAAEHSGGDTIDDQQMSAFRQKVCILGTHHAYQYQTKRRGYDQNVRSLIQIHSVDLVAEEATGVPNETYAKRIADDFHILWMNVDLSREERRYVPDINQAGFGTLFDFELQLLREWVWVIRTAKAVKRSALLICGWVHITGVAEKFWRIGFDVETNLYFDRRDDKISETIE